MFNSGGEDVRALSGRVPSLNIESSFGRAFPRFYIRGYGNTDFRLNASQPVSLIYDDVVQENPILKGFPVFDLERVEVLAGPQGTLFGRNTPAGVVKFDSVEPSQKQRRLLQREHRHASAPPTSKARSTCRSAAHWAARVSLQYAAPRRLGHDTARRPSDQHARRAMTTRALRAQLLYKPSSDFSALFNVHGARPEGQRAAVPRQHHQARHQRPGRRLRPGQRLDRRQERADAADLRRQRAPEAGTLGGVNLHSITGYETVHSFSRGDIDGGYGAVFAPPSGPGLIIFPSETADGDPRARPVHAGVPRRVALRRAVQVAGRAVLLPREVRDRQPMAMTRWQAARRPASCRPSRRTIRGRLFGSVNYDVTRRSRCVPGCATRTTRRTCRLRPRQASITSEGAVGASQRLEGQLGPVGHLRADARRQPVCARGHRLPRLQHPAGVGTFSAHDVGRAGDDPVVRRPA